MNEIESEVRMLAGRLNRLCENHIWVSEFLYKIDGVEKIAYAFSGLSRIIIRDLRHEIGLLSSENGQLIKEVEELEKKLEKLQELAGDTED
jgi:O-acetylhomoserine/O-acetylserine sulfhydrylase-like pyridoxal-dependent enzyme